MKILMTWHWRTVTRMVKPVISALLIHLSVYYLCFNRTVKYSIKAVTTYILPWVSQALSAALISIALSYSLKPVFIGLSSYITRHNTATCTCDVRR